MWHALGEAVTPLRLKTVAANVFTHPEIATVGVGFEAVTSGRVPARTVTLPLATNARAKMQGHRDGFVKIYCRPATGVVVGAVVVAPDASELIFPLALAVQRTLTVADLDRSLEHESGLAALGGLDRPLAFEVFTYRVAQAAAAMAVALGGLDVLVFSGGIGENRPDVREAVASRLGFLGDFATEVVHAREDVMIARGVRSLLAPG